MSPNEQKQVIDQWAAWCEINSGSYHLEGLERMGDALASAFGELGGAVERIALPDMEYFTPQGERARHGVGRALRVRKRPKAPVQVLLCGHMDTVYGPEHPFQKVSFSEDGTRIIGPGVADMKGGLMIMLCALREFEACKEAESLGWEVLVCASEEIGSKSMQPVFKEVAARNQMGFLFEPSFPDGALVRSRKGSGYFNAVVQGRAAHVGRAFAEGRNAIMGLAEWITQLHELNREFPGAIVNVGHVEGGGPLNIVPDRAVAQFNIRVSTAEEQKMLQARIEQLMDAFHRNYDGLQLRWEGEFLRPPKHVGKAEEVLFEQIRELAVSEGEQLTWRDTGGCCDGNNLAAFGLPNIDSLGVCGGNEHRTGEFAIIGSLFQRVRLTVKLLRKIAERG